MYFLNKLGWAVIAICIINAGCTKLSSTADFSAKSIDYYTSHPREAQETTNQCLEAFNKKISALPQQAQEEWKSTPEGINCNNAAIVTVRLMHKNY